MKICELTKRHWAIILGTIAAFVIVPLVVNILLSIPAVIPFDDNGWLSFLGGYLGSVIMAGVTLFVLKKQLNQNHEENEANRCNNESANKENRELQLQLFKYQQENQWLDKVRDAASNYLQIYNRNDFVEVIYQSAFAPQISKQMIKGLYDRPRALNTKLYFTLKNDDGASGLKGVLNKSFEQYCSVLNDIQSVITYRMAGIHPTENLLGFCARGGLEVSKEMKNLLQPSGPYPLDVFALNSILFQRISIIDTLANDVQQALHDYINEEQERINKYLIEK